MYISDNTSVYIDVEKISKNKIVLNQKNIVTLEKMSVYIMYIPMYLILYRKFYLHF